MGGSTATYWVFDVRCWMLDVFPSTMITFLHGKLVEALPTQVVVEVNGVGYEALIPLSSFDKLPQPGGDGETAHATRHPRGRALALRFHDRGGTRFVPPARQHRFRHRPENRAEHLERHQRDGVSRRGGRAAT